MSISEGEGETKEWQEMQENHLQAGGGTGRAGEKERGGRLGQKVETEKRSISEAARGDMDATWCGRAGGDG